jgi:hypothetical protein
MRPEDRAFCANSWLKSFSHSPSTNGHLMGQDFRRAWTPIVDGLLDRATTDVLVNPEDNSQILGFICYTAFPEGPLAIHWVTVKWLLRDQAGRQDNPQLAMMLLGHAGVSRSQFAYTFKTKAWEAYVRKHSLNAEYCPQLRSQV